MTVLVVLEPQGNGLRRTSYEVITAALAIPGATVTGVAMNATNEQLQTAGDYGLTSCLNVTGDAVSTFSNGTFATVVAEVARKTGATVVLFGANATGKDVAPRVAVKLGAGFVPDCVALTANGDTLQAVRPVYAGKAELTVKPLTASAVYTLRPNVFTARKGAGASVSVEAFSPAIDAGVRTARVTNVVKNEGALDVSEADIVVSGGRGLKGPEHFHLVEELARSLGGAVGASRAVVDAGWRPHREQVGQTGKTVSPNMYVACGISGAVQHLAGMSSSKIIVAINKDKEAPIFKMADYGIVGDVFEVLPKLTQKISAITGK